MKKLLINGAQETNINLSEEQVDKLIGYLELILKWNKTYNLSAIRNMEQGVNKHLVDSLSILPHINNKPLLDVGSGAGLPGIVIAIMRPELAVSVIDSVGKKCRFMQFVKTDLKLKNLTIINKRVEEFKADFCFGQISSRAFAQIDKTLELTKHLLCDNGEYLLMKSVNFDKEKSISLTNAYKLNIVDLNNKKFLLKIRRKK